MTRALPILLAAVGCAQNASELRHTATLDAETDGVVLSYDGTDAWAAMRGTTCTIDTSWGCPTQDLDLPTEDEHIVDAFEGTTLATSSQGVYILEGGAWVDTLDLEGVRTARITHEGVLVVAGDATDCALTSAFGSIELPAAVCAASDVTVDRAGALIAATEDGLYRLDPAGVVRIEGSGDTVASDPATGILVTAARGTSTLVGRSDAGVVWTVDAPGPVKSLAMRGDRGEALVLVDEGDRGSLVRVDAADGSTLASYPLPTAEGQVVVSGDGRTLGIVHPEQVHWYRLEVDGEEAVVDADVPSCLDMAGFQSPAIGD